MAEPTAIGSPSVQFTGLQGTAPTASDTIKSERRKSLVRTASQSFVALAKTLRAESQAPTPVSEKKVDTVEPKKLNALKRSSKRLSKAALKPLLGLDSSSSNVATPNDIKQVAQQKLELFSKETKKERSFLATLSGKAPEIEKTHTYNLVTDAKFLAHGATVLAFKVPSLENPNKEVVMKLAQGGPDKAQELVRDTAVVQRLNGGKSKKARGIQKNPYEVRVLSEESKNKVLEKKPTNIEASDVQNTAVMVKKYSGDLAHTAGEMSFEERVRAASDLFAGMERMLDEGTVNLDLKPQNVLVAHQEGRVKQADFSDFGSAFFKDEILKNPDILNTLTWTNAFALNTDIKRFNAACSNIDPEATDKDSLRANKKSANEAIDIAHESMAFSFGLILFDLFSAKEGVQESSSPFVVDQNVVDPNTNESIRKPVRSETLAGFVRIESEPEDLGPPKFNRDACPEVPRTMIGIMEGLLRMDPKERMSIKEAYKEFKAFERTVHRY